LTLDFDWFFHPEHGIIPHDEVKRGYTLLALAPKSNVFLWGVHLLGITHGICLLLGIAPRLQSFGIFINLVSFLNQSSDNLLYSGQDIIMRTLAWMLCFLPLGRLSIYEYLEYCRQDKPGQRKELIRQSDSWPMWPFRLLQIQVCFVFVGAGLAKAADPIWQDGSAMYYIIHHHDNLFGLTIFAPDFIYNRVLPLKLMTWASIILECSSLLLVWSKATRMPTVIIMMIFHFSIDLAMNLHVFQWLMIVLWLSFLAEPCSESVMMKRTNTVK